ncbi:MAG: hypothetical protein ACI36V_00950 [Coriobacteriales bacterium]
MLSSAAASSWAQEALGASAQRLGHPMPPAFAVVGGMGPDELRLLVCERDPWSVVAIDGPAAALLGESFLPQGTVLAPDSPVEECGYTLVAVPGFEECFDNPELKRCAWERLKAAAHPPAL